MRIDDDEWDITTGVGVTALAVASARAIETQRDDGLVDDPYAKAFVDAAPSVPLPSGVEADGVWITLSTYVGVRSRFFDTFVADATARGLHQVVLLAAGLDTRAFRLTWPAGSTVYEVDQPGVLDFKNEVLGEQGAHSAAHRVVVAVDLRHDWPAALQNAGFDPAQPTAWLAEGLLPLLPAKAEADLFARIQHLSAPGSQIAVEHFGSNINQFTSSAAVQTISQDLGIDVNELLYDERREQEPADWLTAHSWDVATSTPADLARDYGRPLDDSVLHIMGRTQLLQATLRTR